MPASYEELAQNGSAPTSSFAITLLAMTDQFLSSPASRTFRRFLATEKFRDASLTIGEFHLPNLKQVLDT